MKMSRNYFTPDVVDTLSHSYLKDVRRNWMHFCSCGRSEPLLISMYFYSSGKVIYRDKHCRLSLLFFLPQLRLRFCYCWFLILIFFVLAFPGALCDAIIVRARRWRYCLLVFCTYWKSDLIRPKWPLAYSHRRNTIYGKAKPRTPKIKDEARVKADSRFMNKVKRSFKMPALIEITQWRK